MKVLTFIVAAVLTLTNTSALAQTVPNVPSHISDAKIRATQLPSMFCSNGYVYRSSGEQIKYAVDGKTASFGSNRTCAQSISGNLFCSNGFVYRSSGEQVKYAVDGKAASFGSNKTCAQAIGRREQE